TCPAARSYPGMCKHAAAVAVVFRRDPSSFEGYRGLSSATTSPSLTRLLATTAPPAQKSRSTKEAPGTLRLELTLEDARYGLSARFRVVSPHGSYVLKSLSEFVERMDNRAFYEYGKKLAFTHTQELFTPQARRVIRYLRRMAGGERRRNGRSWYVSDQLTVSRDLYLSEADAIDLLDLYVDEPFLYDDGTHISAKPEPACIVNGNPPLTLRVQELHDGGYQIMRDAPLRILQFGDRAYVAMDGTFYRCTEEFADAARFLSAVYCSWDDQLVLSGEDVPRFCSTLLPQLQALTPEPCTLEFYLDRDGQDCSCLVKAVYGMQHVNPLADEDNRSIPLRDFVTESMARATVESYLPDVGPDGIARTTTVDEAGHLLFNGVAELRLLGTVFCTPAFERMASTATPRVQTGVSLVGNLINLKVKADELDPGDLWRLLNSYQQKKRYHKLSDGSYLSLMGTAGADMGLDQLSAVAQGVDLSAAQLEAGVAELPLYHAFLLDGLLPDQGEDEEDLRKDQAFQEFVGQFDGVAAEQQPVPREVQHILRPYQQDGYQWLCLLARSGFGGILADEMGLGKSLQVISWLLGNRAELDRMPALVVCPASLVYNWQAEFAKFAPGLQVQVVAGAKAQRAAQRCNPSCQVFVTSYDSLRIDVDAWEERSFFACVIDEAQYIKNGNAKVTRSVKRMQAEHRLALTGTPVENRLSELWSIFDFLMPGMLGSYNRFKERYELPIVGGDEPAAERLRNLVGRFILRRRKADVLSDLPDKLEQVIRCPMDGEQLKLYNAHEQRLRMELDEKADVELAQGKLAVLAELTKLRQICCDPRLLYENARHAGVKMAAILDLVEAAQESEQKVLVFSQFTSFLQLIEDELKRRRIGYYKITGSTPKKQRVELVDAFNANDVPVFLISLKAGGTGLNLTGASVVIHADPWWNAAAQSQATDRAHRIGQERTVTVYQVICQDSIEERILTLQAAKTDLADQVLSSQGMSLGQLSREQLVELLSQG
ncbi:MAG: DEAD/DEAH box helicase, partial [Coriobacteriia bacterium]|nr:DEAD/DEAH box helicase [Coriobacteriia bacterium]